MLSPKKQGLVNQLINHILAGERYMTVMAKYTVDWRISSRTFDRYWKEANLQHAATQQEIQKQIAESTIELEVTHRIEAILTSQQRKELLSQIATGTIKVKSTQVKWDPTTSKFVTIPVTDEPTPQVRIAAIKELNEMEGEHKSRKNNPVELPPADPFKQKTEEELQQILEQQLKIFNNEIDG